MYATGSGAEVDEIPQEMDSQPVDAIATWLQGNGFICVRLTYSMDMALNPDQKVADASELLQMVLICSQT